MSAHRRSRRSGRYPPRHAISPLLLVTAAFVLPGCGPYLLKGRVIPGDSPHVLVVPKSDSRLDEGPGIPGATISLRLDPNSLGGRDLAGGVSDGDGRFAIPIDEFGAGLLEYDLGVRVRQRGHSTTYDVIGMPGSGLRVLVILPRGPDAYEKPYDPQDDLRDFPLDR